MDRTKHEHNSAASYDYRAHNNNNNNNNNRPNNNTHFLNWSQTFTGGGKATVAHIIIMHQKTPKTYYGDHKSKIGYNCTQWRAKVAFKNGLRN